MKYPDLRAGLATCLLTSLMLAPLQAREVDVVDRARSFLSSYMRGDTASVMAQVDQNIDVYGSDTAEVFHGYAGLRRMMDADLKLWGGPARIGDLQNLSVVSDGKLSVLTFQAPFLLGSRPGVIVRFSMVWRREADNWRLVQSANSTPSVGQSADALRKLRN